MLREMWLANVSFMGISQRQFYGYYPTSVLWVLAKVSFMGISQLQFYGY